MAIPAMMIPTNTANSRTMQPRSFRSGWIGARLSKSGQDPLEWLPHFPHQAHQFLSFFALILGLGRLILRRFHR